MNSTPAIYHLRRMKQFYLTLLLMCAVAVSSGSAQTPQPYYLISGAISNPNPINAVTVENVGNVQISNTDDVLFDFQNMLNFINRGPIVAAPGIEFNNFNPFVDARGPLATFVNESTILASTRLLISSTSIQNNNNALLGTSRTGLIKMQGSTVDLEGAQVVAADGTSAFGNVSEGAFGSIRDNQGNFYYFNPNNIRDEYWGATNGGNIVLPGISQGGVSRTHTVRDRSGFRTSQQLNVNANSFNFGFFPTNFFSTNGYLYFPFTNNMVFIDADTIRNTSFLVFVRTNANSPEITTSFLPSTNSANFDVYDVAVQFATTDLDPLTGQVFTRYLTLFDESMFLARVNTAGLNATFNLASNLDRPGYFRPINYSLVRSDFPFFFGFPVAPVAYTNIIFPGSGNFNERFITNQVDHEFAAWGFTVSPRDFGGDLGLNPTLSDPTNSPGRVEITAADLNLRFARIKADNLISITVSNQLTLDNALLDAPNISINVPGTNNVTFSNNFPTTLSRLNGEVAVWTGVWRVDQRVTNATFLPGFVGTIEHAYQVVVIDNTLTTNTPFVLRDFTVQAQEVTLGDDLVLGGNLVIAGTCLHIPTNGVISLSAENTDFNVADAPNLLCLLNEGIFNVPLLINLGTDRVVPYTNVYNSGQFTSGSILIRSDNFTNSGLMLANGGSMGITATTNYLQGGFLFSAANITLAGNHLSLTGATLSAAAQLNLTFTNFLGDNGFSNNISVGNGFRLLTRPNKGDLMATRIVSTVPNFQSRSHVWGAEDRGATPSGFANNTAIQHLVLDGGTNSQFRFQGVSTSNAMYVNYLEFLGGTTNTNGLHVTSSLFVNPNLTIYFADSNVPEDKLTNAFPGRLVWVDPAITVGPMVAVPLTAGQYAQLTTRQFQTMLAPGGDFDDDGVPNERDDSPMSGFTVSEVTVINVPTLMAFIKWQAVAGVTYTIEYLDGLNAGAWHTLYSIQATENKEITATDVPPAGGQRFYRVRYSVNQ